MSIAEVETLRSFVFERLLNQDTRAKSVNLLGKINDQPAIVIAEKMAFIATSDFLEDFTQTAHLSAISLMERNDIYHWFLASQSSKELPQYAEAKITLIYPATETHIRKYSFQSLRMVTETPEIYQSSVWPYIESKRSGGRLNWVYNILEHRAESERIIAEDPDSHEGFILLPDLKWDRKTMNSMYTMALVNRRDVASIRDLKKKDAPWLRKVQAKIVEGICKMYPAIEGDQIRLYVHYHPSYYHFHIHAVSVSHDGGPGQAAGKAFLLGNVISQLESMSNENSGFGDVELTLFLGEESELWQHVFLPEKSKDLNSA